MHRGRATIAGLMWTLARRRVARRHVLFAGAGALVLWWRGACGGGERREFHRELAALRELDCPTPGCGRDACGTGWMRLRPHERWYDHERGANRVGRWYVEARCPRCGETFERWTPAYQQLCERLAASRGCG